MIRGQVRKVGTALRRPRRVLGALLTCLPKAAALSLKGRWWRPSFSGELQLPFATDTMLRSYLYTAYPAGILTARGVSIDELCPYYTQLLFPHSKLTRAGRHRSQVRFFPAYPIERLTALGYFATRPWSEEEIDRPHSALIADLWQALDAGRYVFVRANECYMPGSRTFLRMDHRHGFLITGYDPRRRSFTGPAYGTDGEFRMRSVPAMFMAEAIRSSRGGVAGGYNEARQVLEVEPASTAPGPVDVSGIMDQLHDYAHGTDGGHKYLNGRFTPAGLADIPPAYNDQHDRHGAHGTRIYDSFRRYVSAVIQDGDDVDLRATRVLMDHKHMIAACLRILARAGWIDEATSGPYADVVRLATALHHAALAWTVTHDRGAGRRVYDLVDDLYSAEMESLALVLEQQRTPARL